MFFCSFELKAMSKIILMTNDELTVLIKQAVHEALESYVISAERPTTSNEILDVKEASTFLKISVQTIYGKTSTRSIPHFKRGKKIYFKRAELLEWLTENKQKTQAELLKEWEERSRK